MNERVITDPSQHGWVEVDGKWVWDAASGGGAGAGMVISETEPTDKAEGMQWLNPTNGLVLFWDDEKWLQMPTTGAAGKDGVDGLWTDNGDTSISYTAGNVGIGNNAPLSALDVKGKLTLSAAGGIDVTGSNSTFSQAAFRMYRSGDGDITGNFCRIRTRGDGAGNAVEMVFDTNSAEAMLIDADGLVTVYGGLKYIDQSTGTVAIEVQSQYGRGRFGCWNNYPAMMHYGSGVWAPSCYHDFNNDTFNITASVLEVNGSPVTRNVDLIETLLTLRNATMDETQDIRESLRDAIDELVAGFEQEIAAMPAPEPEASTQEIGDE
jgi:hypothetical protein